jgi:5-formyltetrahydrofolate cyclo-ligase
MLAVQIKDFQDLSIGNYGILEPKNRQPKIDENSIDVCYVPGLAFDSRGGRVGYGGRFYDRFLKKIGDNCKKIALAYGCQILEEIPMEEHDAFIDGIITD